MLNELFNHEKFDLAMEMGFADLRARIYVSVGGQLLYFYRDDLRMQHRFLQGGSPDARPHSENQLADVHR